jgi:alpha,alpha-trehalase
MRGEETSIRCVCRWGFGARRCAAFVTLVLLTAALPARAPARPPGPALADYPPPPEVLFKDLFDAVQSEALYGDGKTFVDATPDAAPEVILAQYHAAPPDSAEALRSFVAAHFQLPAQPAPVASAPAETSIVAHIDGLWNRLTRDTPTAPPYSSLLPLPAPYVVPGGRFREIYYWDSYFTMLGLTVAGGTTWSGTWCETSPTSSIATVTSRTAPAPTT